jgi:hypothetical protein
MLGIMPSKVITMFVRKLGDMNGIIGGMG